MSLKKSGLFFNRRTTTTKRINSTNKVVIHPQPLDKVSIVLSPLLLMISPSINANANNPTNSIPKYMIIKENNPRQAIISSYNRPVLYNNIVLFNGRRLIRFR